MRFLRQEARLLWALIVGLLLAGALFMTLRAVRRCPEAPCPPPPASVTSVCLQAVLQQCPVDAVDLLVPLATGAAATLVAARVGPLRR